MSDSTTRLDVHVLEAGVVVRGELDAESADRLATALHPLLTGGPVRLDLTAVTFIDSTGLSAVLRAHRCAEEAGGTVEIVPSRRVRRLFDLAGLDGYLHVDELHVNER